MKTKPCRDCGKQFTGGRSRCQPCYGHYRWQKAPEKYDSAKHLEKHRRHQLRKKYGITLEQYNAMLEAQGSRCAICEVVSCPTGQSFAVDHCHETGTVRALLCVHCNETLGAMKDSPELLLKAAEYLRKHGR